MNPSWHKEPMDMARQTLGRGKSGSRKSGSRRSAASKQGPGSDQAARQGADPVCRVSGVGESKGWRRQRRVSGRDCLLLPHRARPRYAGKSSNIGRKRLAYPAATWQCFPSILKYPMYCLPLSLRTPAGQVV